MAVERQEVGYLTLYEGKRVCFEWVKSPTFVDDCAALIVRVVQSFLLSDGLALGLEEELQSQDNQEGSEGQEGCWIGSKDESDNAEKERTQKFLDVWNKKVEELHELIERRRCSTRDGVVDERPRVMPSQYCMQYVGRGVEEET